MINELKDRVMIQEKQVFLDAFGETIVWNDLEERWSRRISLDVETRLIYMQKHTEVTDSFLFRGWVDLELAKHRIIWKDRIYELVETGQFLDNETIVLARYDSEYEEGS